MKEKEKDNSTGYFHSLIEKYQNQLINLEVTYVDGELSEREIKFNELKSDIEKEFEKYKQPFLLVNLQADWKREETNILCYNAFTINYYHDGYYSRIKIYLINAISNKLVDVTLNCYVIKEYDKKVKLTLILSDLIKVKNENGNK